MSAEAVRNIMGFAPQAFLDEVTSSVDRRLDQGVDKLRQDLIKIASNRGLKDVTPADCNEACEKLLRKMKKHFDKNMDKFDIYASRNIFVLPTDDSSAQNKSKEKENLENKSLELDVLKNRYYDLLAEYSSKTSDIKESEVLLDNMRNSLFQIRVASQAMDEHNLQPLAETLSTIVKQKKELLVLCDKATNLVEKMGGSSSSIDRRGGKSPGKGRASSGGSDGDHVATDGAADMSKVAAALLRR